MMELLLDILKWLVPAGGISVLLTWLTSRRIRRSQADKTTHEVYRQMYEELRATMITLNDSNRQLQIQVARMERLVLRAPTCTHYASCPIRRELRGKTSEGYPIDLREYLRQHEPQGDARGELRNRTQRDDTVDTLDDRPP